MDFYALLLVEVKSDGDCHRRILAALGTALWVFQLESRTSQLSHQTAVRHTRSEAHACDVRAPYHDNGSTYPSRLVDVGRVRRDEAEPNSLAACRAGCGCLCTRAGCMNDILNDIFQFFSHVVLSDSERLFLLGSASILYPAVYVCTDVVTSY